MLSKYVNNLVKSRDNEGLTQVTGFPLSLCALKIKPESIFTFEFNPEEVSYWVCWGLCYRKCAWKQHFDKIVELRWKGWVTLLVHGLKQLNCESHRFMQYLDSPCEVPWVCSVLLFAHSLYLVSEGFPFISLACYLFPHPPGGAVLSVKGGKKIQHVSNNLHQIRSWVGSVPTNVPWNSWKAGHQKWWNYLRFYFFWLEQQEINQGNDVMSSQCLHPKLCEQFCEHL